VPVAVFGPPFDDGVTFSSLQHGQDAVAVLFNLQRDVAHAGLRPHCVGTRKPFFLILELFEIETVFKGSPVVDGRKTIGLTPTDETTIFRERDSLDSSAYSLKTR
jgi:hypothetical protein